MMFARRSHVALTGSGVARGPRAFIAPIWDTARPPSASDFKKPLVLRVPPAEASAKVRDGDPIDDDADMDGPHWAGIVPLTSTWGTPFAATDLADGIATPESVVALGGRNAHPA